MIRVPQHPHEDIVRPRNDLSIHLGEHWAIPGSTGSGKTYFASRGLLEYLRTHFPHAKRYILDSTDDPDMETSVHAPLVVEGNHVPDILREAAYTLIWKPRSTKLPGAYAEFFDKLNDARDASILMIDELASITGEAIESLEALLKQMRKHKGTVIGLTQTIAGSDTVLFSQCTHYCQFRLGKERYDLAQSRHYLDISAEEQRQPRYQYGFFYRNQKSQYSAKEYKDMSDFFRGALHS